MLPSCRAIQRGILPDGCIPSEGQILGGIPQFIEIVSQDG